MLEMPKKLQDDIKKEDRILNSIIKSTNYEYMGKDPLEAAKLDYKEYILKELKLMEEP